MVDAEHEIVRSLRKASVLKFISFCRGRLSFAAILKYLPELAPVQNFLEKHSISEWAVKMSAYDQTYTTAPEGGLQLIKNEQNLHYRSLDVFLLQVYPDKLAEAIDSWAIFAERLLPLIRADPDARSWKINRKIIIHRRHWLLLSKRIMAVVTTISFKLLTGPVARVDFREQLHSRSPGRDMLISAALRVARMYGIFALGKRCCSLPIGHDRVWV
jgi:hypothetical protein